MLSVLIATPVHDGKFFVDYVKSLVETVMLLDGAGVKSNVHFVSGNPYLAEARNRIVAYFMQTDFTDLLFVDADVGWAPQAIVKILPRRQEIVAGVYPLKNDRGGYPVVLRCQEDGRPIVDPESGLLLAQGLPGGLMRIKRTAIEKLIAAYPELYYRDGKYGDTWNLFSCELKDGRWTGEDFWFCGLWEKIGGQLWVEPDLELTHTGSKTWMGNYHEYLKSLPRV